MVLLEGVIAAVGIKALGGDFQGILLPEDAEQEERCRKMGIEPNTVLQLDDMVKVMMQSLLLQQ